MYKSGHCYEVRKSSDQKIYRFKLVTMTQEIGVDHYWGYFEGSSEKASLDFIISFSVDYIKDITDTYVS